MKQISAAWKIWLGVVTLAALWGSAWLAIKIGLEDTAPFHAAAPRFAVAVGALYVWMRLSGGCFTWTRRFWTDMAFQSWFMFILPYGLVYWGEVHVAAGLGAVLFSTQSLFVMLFSHLLLTGEKASIRKGIGLLLGLGGLVLIFHDRLQWMDRWGFWGMLAVLGAAASGGFALVWLKRMGGSKSLLPELTAQIGLTAVAFTAIALFLETPRCSWMSVRLWATIFYLGLLGTAFAFAIYYWLAKRASALMTSFSVFASPVFAVFLGWLILGETLGLPGLAGAALVIASIVLVLL